MNYLKKGNEVLPVISIYPYRYDNGQGKIVLRLQVPGSVLFDAIQAFFNAVADYDHYEVKGGKEEKKCTYTQYGADLDIHYKKPQDVINADGTITTQEAFYDVEVLRDPSLDAEIRRLQEENVELKGQIGQLEEQNNVLAEQNNALAEQAGETDLLLAELLYGGM